LKLMYIPRAIDAYPSACIITTEARV